MTSPLIQFAPEDAPALLEVSRSVGWPQELSDWQTALAASQIFGQRDAGGKVLSSAGIYQYGSELASLALVLVREEVRRQGLARAAIDRCLQMVPGVPVMLVATSFGQPLYESMGFQTVEQIVRLVAPAGGALRPAGTVEAMTDADLPLALQLDRMAYAADRSRVLRRRWELADSGAMLPDGTGFAWKTVQRAGLMIGPVIASNVDDATRLVAHLTEGFAGHVKLEIPERHAALIAKLAGAGFEIDGARALMLKGADALPGRRELLFGLASLGFG